MSTEWFPCEWKYLGPKPFGRLQRLYVFLFLVLLLLISSKSIIGAFFLFVLALPSVLLYVLIRRSGKDSVIYRDMMRLPQKGDYSIARGHLFLRIPKFSESYVKPRKMIREDERTVKVTGKWPWQSYRVILSDGFECSKFIRALEVLGTKRARKGTFGNITS
jgi:hypothetical protein